MKLALILILLGNVSMSVSTNYVVHTFELQVKSNIVLENACIDKQTGKIYVGAKNMLYEFGEDLVKLVEVDTGPEMENVNCLYSFLCKLPKTLTDSYSKAILIDYENNNLIHCITLYNGVCVKHDLNNITRTSEPTYFPVVANTDTASTFAFIAPGPLMTGNGKYSSVLNIGVQYTNTSRLRHSVPGFTSRRLSDFNLVNSNLLQKSEIRIDFSSENVFPILYVYGFSSEGFSYMITVQKQSPYNETYISKIFRVCQRDSNFYSYAEIQLQCWNSGKLYNLAQSAYLGKAGNQLADALNISTSQDVLYVTFSVGKAGSNIPSHQSALCIYPMKNVRKVFTRNIKDCFEGKNITGPKHIFDHSCIKVPGLEVDETYCGEHQINSPIAGPIPVSVEAAVTFQTVMTALNVDVDSYNTIAFAGSKNGHIYKVVIEKQTSATIFEDVVIADGEAIKSSLLFDIGHEHIYAMTKYKLMQMKLYDCCQYTTCNACINANNPYCGWCSQKNRCSGHKECNQTDEMKWLPYRGSFCPKITRENTDNQKVPYLSSITTLIGPQSGGTSVIIHGSNLDTRRPTAVKIGGNCCSLMRNFTAFPTALICKTNAGYTDQLNKQLEVVVYVDGARVSARKTFMYRYVEDPTITSIKPKSSYQSGGRILKIDGINMFATQNPMMYTVVGGAKMKPEACRRNDAEKAIYCPTPKYTQQQISTHSAAETNMSIDGVPARLGFEMDGVSSVTADNLAGDLGSFMYYPDPVLHNLTEVMVVNDSKSNIVIKGENLMPGADISEVEVKIGCEVCKLISMTAVEIMCKPPAEEPVCDQSNEQQLRINVSVGQFHWTVGFLTYNMTSSVPSTSNTLVVVAVLVVIGAAVILSTGAVIICYKRRNNHSAGRSRFVFRNENNAEEAELIHEGEET